MKLQNYMAEKDVTYHREKYLENPLISIAMCLETCGEYISIPNKPNLLFQNIWKEEIKTGILPAEMPHW